jgi:hypothetical protein
MGFVNDLHTMILYHKFIVTSISDLDEWHCDESNEFHCENGPVVILSTGEKVWFVNNNPIESNRAYQKVTKLTDEEMILMILKYGNAE